MPYKNVIYCTAQRCIMQETKLTVRVARNLLENAKRYASENNTTLTDLIGAYLEKLPVKQAMENAPLVRNLSGSVSDRVSVKDYHRHLDEKYGK
jgi:hypothetical protein